jgi:hypothetical protein
VDPRTGLDDMERRKLLPLSGLEFRPLGRPARRQFVLYIHDIYNNSFKTVISRLIMNEYGMWSNVALLTLIN